MSPLFPKNETLKGSIYSPMSKTTQPSPYLARTELYNAWSVVDDAKDKAVKIGNEASKEFEKASSKAQATTGKIELYTGKYYAACTFGGLLACVSVFMIHLTTALFLSIYSKHGESRGMLHHVSY